MVKTIENQSKIYFADEAVFSSKQSSVKVWAKKGEISPFVARNKISFEAVAVVSAIDVYGKVTAVLTNPKSIRTDSFLEFLK